LAGKLQTHNVAHKGLLLGGALLRGVSLSLHTLAKVCRTFCAQAVDKLYNTE